MWIAGSADPDRQLTSKLAVGSGAFFWGFPPFNGSTISGEDFLEIVNKLSTR